MIIGHLSDSSRQFHVRRGTMKIAERRSAVHRKRTYVKIRGITVQNPYDENILAVSGTATGNPDPYSFVSCSTESFVENDSGATTGTLGTVNDFSYADDNSDAYEYTLSGPPASTITDLSTTTESSSGTSQDSSNGTLIPAYWNTYANALATSMGTSPLDAPIQDGTTSGEWDTSQGLASAVGGQDMHVLQFTGAEVQPAISGSAVALEQGGGGSGVWASHPSAIGYRRQGYTTGGSHGGSGSGTITIAAVAPEFDSGMNAGTGQDEVERLGNFGQGAEENPTVVAIAADFAGESRQARPARRDSRIFCKSIRMETTIRPIS